MLVILTAILIIAILVLCSNRGAKAIITAGIDLMLLMAALFLISMGLNPVAVTEIAAVIIAAVTLFYQNGFNAKTRIAFAAVIIVFIALIPLLLLTGMQANIQGISPAQYEIAEVNGYEKKIGISMMLVEISVILMALVGAAVDLSLSITSALYEIHLNNPQLGRKELIASGINISRDILGTTIHTLFYIYMAEFMALMIQFISEYNFLDMINSKAFSQEIMCIGISALGCCAVIPITVIISAFRFRRYAGSEMSIIEKTDKICFQHYISILKTMIK